MTDMEKFFKKKEWKKQKICKTWTNETMRKKWKNGEEN